MTDLPADLPDLLRLACRSGKLRLYVSHGSPHGYKADLARSGQGWDAETDPDALEAITKVLAGQYGRMLERERAAAPDDEPADDDDDIIDWDEITDAVRNVLVLDKLTRDFPDAEIARLAAAIAEQIFPEPRPQQHETEYRYGEECRYCADTGNFYGDSELGPCGCERTRSDDDFAHLGSADIDIDGLIG